MTIDKKLKDWNKIKSVMWTIQNERGNVRSRAIEEMYALGKTYTKKYRERFNPLLKPK